MIITKTKPQDEILELTKRHRRLFIVGCGSCAEQCRTGGEEDIKVMKGKLEESGKEITGSVVSEEACNVPLIKRELRENKREVEEADAVLVMACGAGTTAVREATRIRVYPALDTVSLANKQRHGDFVGRCSLCGSCILGVTGGLCPVTICPKGILNGPCGGMGGGKCEVNNEEDCVWVRIYDVLKEHNDIDSMKRLKEPKDYSKMQRNARICFAKN